MQRFLFAIAFCAGFARGFALAETEGGAAAMEVDMQLVLAVDVSRSMSPRELEIQRRGYAAALTSDQVMGAILDGPLGRIAITYVEWAGSGSQRVLVPWRLVESPSDAAEIARLLLETPRSSARRTSISGGMLYAAALFEESRYTSFRRVIDISGDGPNNQGIAVTVARDSVIAEGITVNGLPLMTREGNGATWHLDDLDLYYQNCVIGGVGAFMIPVRDWDEFPAAVRRKLVLEIADVGGTFADLVVPVQDRGYDCLVGERRWRAQGRDWEMP
jgi:hypothetical protein